MTTNSTPALPSGPINSRALTRQIATEMVAQHITPVPERVRKAIVERTAGQRNPSSATIQEELQSWYADTFWPTYEIFGTLPADSQVPQQLRQLFTDSFRSLVVGAMEIAKSSYDQDSSAYEREIAELREHLRQEAADREAQGRKFKEMEDRLAEAMNMILQFETNAAESAIQVTELERRLRMSLETQVQLEQQISEVRETEREHAKTQVNAARDDMRRVMIELDEARQTVKTMQASADRSAAQMAELRENAARLQTHNEMLQAAAAREQQEKERQQSEESQAKTETWGTRKRIGAREPLRRARIKPVR